jgi:hypothetical protein
MSILLIDGSGFVFKGRAVHKNGHGLSVLEDVSSRLPRNVGHQSTSNATPHPRTRETSTAQLQKSKKWINPSVYTRLISLQFFSLNVMKCNTDWQAVMMEVK